MGTALAVIYTAARQGKKIQVYADETRPLLQGARLTTWELMKARIPVTLICDNMAAVLMAQGKIDAVIVGADRITMSGDFANKVGTYTLAVLARHHGVKFYVAAPLSSFDPNLSSGKDIPIELRSPDEVTIIGGKQLAPHKVRVFNPAFDVTPGKKFVTAFITEKGVIHPPFKSNIKKIMTG
jgi:methylthioribose-1-phosphate isomerase